MNRNVSYHNCDIEYSKDAILVNIHNDKCSDYIKNCHKLALTKIFIYVTDAKKLHIALSHKCIYNPVLLSFYSRDYCIKHGWSQYISLYSEGRLMNICLGQICKTADQLVLDGLYEEALDIVMAIIEREYYSLAPWYER